VSNCFEEMANRCQTFEHLFDASEWVVPVVLLWVVDMVVCTTLQLFSFWFHIMCCVAACAV
jgi:hypothetical protein